MACWGGFSEVRVLLPAVTDPVLRADARWLETETMPGIPHSPGRAMEVASTMARVQETVKEPLTVETPDRLAAMPVDFPDTVGSTDTEARTGQSIIPLRLGIGSGVTVLEFANTASAIPVDAMAAMVPVSWIMEIKSSNACSAGPFHPGPVVRGFRSSASTTWSTPISRVM